MCNHIIALLYVINHWKATNEKEIPSDLSCTSLPQKWHKPRGDKITPEPVMKLSFAKATTDRTQRQRDPVFCYLYDARAKKIRTVPSSEEVSPVKEKIKARSKHIPFTYLTDDKDNSLKETIFGTLPEGSPLSYQLQDYHSTSMEFSAVMPENVHIVTQNALTYPNIPTSNFTSKITWASDMFPQHIISYMQSLDITEAQAIETEAQTVDQANSPLWHQKRKNRLTASKFGEVLNRKSLPSQAFVKNLFSQRNLSNVSSIAYGSSKEDIARQLYIKKMKSRLQHDITVYSSGLLINPNCPYLGASPDGKLIDRSAYDYFGLLEIKCPYSFRNQTPTEAAENPKCCLENQGGRLQLKRSHNYDFQVTGQMAIAGVNWCDFVVYTNKGIFVERILLNKELWNKEMFPKLTEFYINYAVSHLNPRRVESRAGNQSDSDHSQSPSEDA